MSNKVIADKREAGKFCQKVIEQNIDKFKNHETPMISWNYFHGAYPDVNLTYDNFWYHLKTVRNRLGVSAQKNTGAEHIGVDNLEIEELPAQAQTELEIKIYDPTKETVSEEIFHPYRTGKFKDRVVSKKIGFMPGTTIVYTGGPSVGKTTVALDDLYNAKEQFMLELKNKTDRKLADDDFIYFSSEMKRIDLQAEQEEKEWMKEVKSVLMSEYPKNQYMKLIEKVFTHGYRMLVVDSFQNIVERLVAFCNITTNQATTFLMNCIEKANSGDTVTGHNTCIILIQQVTKGGVFVGKNGLKHDTTAFLYFRFDDNKQARYCEFEKNRRNGSSLYKKLYYTLNERNEVEYDEARWTEDREREAISSREKQSMIEANRDFNELFLNKKVGIEEEEEVYEED